MSYCVNCGVELNEQASACPLCHTPVINPNAPPTSSEPPFFPTTPTKVAPESKLAAAVMLTVIFASVALCCGLLNLFLRTSHIWSFYVLGAVFTLWIWFVLPLFVRKIPFFLIPAMDVLCTALYVYLIAVDLNGQDWFLRLALPIIAVIAILLFFLSFLLRDHRRSMLSSAAMVMGTIALAALGIEICLDFYFKGGFHPDWSLVVVTICIAIILPLQIMRHVPMLREEIRRRFHF